MKPLNKNLAYDCSNLSEKEMRELRDECRLYFIPEFIYYDTFCKRWLHSSNLGEFTDAKTLFE